MAVTVTNSNIAKFNVAVELTRNAATSSVIDATELFTITPNTADYKSVVIIENGTGHGSLTYSVAKGNLYGTLTNLTGTVEAGKSMVLELEGGKYLKDGKFEVTLTPATGKRLLTDHAAKVAFVGTK